MATYFHGNSEIQADGLQTLILMNPGYVNYSDTQQQHHHQQQQHHHHHHHQHQQHQQQQQQQQQQHQQQQQPSNFVFLNSASGGGGGYSLAQQHSPHAPPPHTQQFVGIPLPASVSAASQDQQGPSSIHAQHEISALHGFLPRVQYNPWNSIDPSAAARETPRSQQGLSLSLSSQQPGGFGSFRNEREIPTQAQLQPAISPASGEEMRMSGGSPSSASGISNGVSGIQSVLLSSKYLKAAQQVLDEVVNVVNGIKPDAAKKCNGQSKAIGESSVTGEGSAAGETTAKRGNELTTAERQEIQMKKAKLVSMLDEVEQRYRQYHHQMQIVIQSFEQAAGIGSAKTYTALALQTISKQFRCLKDAILGQIRASNKSLGEEDCLGGKMEGSSRLKFVDHQLRQQRALQQLGMIQHNAWRPQRGLPERSVSVLRAWLFEHFLHPYPKDSDKHILAKQTGLTRSQVSNWFINARVRLWKPMVEEMYLEEIKEQEQNGSEDNRTSKSEQNDDSGSKSTALQEKGPVLDHSQSFKSKLSPPINQNVSTISSSTAATSPMGGSLGNHTGFSLIGSSELDGITHGSPKKQRSAEMLHCISSVPSMNMDMKPSEANNEQISMKFGIERQGRDGYSLMGGPANFIGGFGSYPIGEIGRFDAEHYQPRFSGNAVSLSLGLPDNENLSLSGTHQSFFPSQNIQLGRRVELGEPNEFGAMNTPTPPHSTPAYDNINLQNRKRFAAQLLPDFVA